MPLASHSGVGLVWSTSHFNPLLYRISFLLFQLMTKSYLLCYTKNSIHLLLTCLVFFFLNEIQLYYLASRVCWVSLCVHVWMCQGNITIFAASLTYFRALNFDLSSSVPQPVREVPRWDQLIAMTYLPNSTFQTNDASIRVGRCGICNKCFFFHCAICLLLSGRYLNFT